MVFFRGGSPNTPYWKGQRAAAQRGIICREWRECGSFVSAFNARVTEKPLFRGHLRVGPGLASRRRGGFRPSASRSEPCLQLAHRTATPRTSRFRRCGSGDNRKAARRRATPRRNHSPRPARKTPIRRPRRPLLRRAPRRRRHPSGLFRASNRRPCKRCWQYKHPVINKCWRLSRRTACGALREPQGFGPGLSSCQRVGLRYTRAIGILLQRRSLGRAPTLSCLAPASSARPSRSISPSAACRSR